MSERVHWVVPGDTLSALALRYGSSVAALARANNIANPDRIYVGQKLVIPAPPLTATGGPETVVPVPSVPSRPPLEILVTNPNDPPPPVLDRPCPQWWPDSACHVWSRIPLLLAVVAAGAILIAVTRPGDDAPRRAKKRRR
jgi:murein DD-endopeptidase MepM/ murein hydrolase activator NlpD